MRSPRESRQVLARLARQQLRLFASFQKSFAFLTSPRLEPPRSGVVEARAMCQLPSTSCRAYEVFRRGNRRFSGKANDFWKLAKSPKLLPRETREYVPMILAAIVIARSPYAYGFDFGDGDAAGV